MKARAGLARDRKDVARLERKLASAELELCCVARRPEILQPDVREALRLGPARYNREIGASLAPARAGETSRGRSGAAVLGLGVGEAELDLLRKLGLLCAHEAQHRIALGPDEILVRKRRDGVASAREAQPSRGGRGRDAEQAR